MDKMPYGVVTKMLADGWTEKTFVYPSEFTALEHPLKGLLWRDLGRVLPHLKPRLFLQPTAGGWTVGIDAQLTTVTVKDEVFEIEATNMAIAYWPAIEKVLGYYEIPMDVKYKRVGTFRIAYQVLSNTIKIKEREIESLQADVLKLWQRQEELSCPSCKGKTNVLACTVCEGTGWNLELGNG